MGQVVIHGYSDQLLKKYSETVLYQHAITKFSGFWNFWFGGKKMLKFQVKKPTKMISTFPVGVKMCAKVIPTKGKHILKPLSGYITEEKKENWDLVGASRYADLNHRRTAPSCSFQGPTT